MIDVEVLFFANLADRLGTRTCSLSLPSGDLAAVKKALSRQFDGEQMAALFAENVKVARNQQLWDGRGNLADGDELAFLPPVTGG